MQTKKPQNPINSMTHVISPNKRHNSAPPPSRPHPTHGFWRNKSVRITAPKQQLLSSQQSMSAQYTGCGCGGCAAGIHLFISRLTACNEWVTCRWRQEASRQFVHWRNQGSRVDERRQNDRIGLVLQLPDAATQQTNGKKITRQKFDAQQQQLHVIAPQNYPQPQQLQQLGTFTPAPPIQRQTPDPIFAPETQQANTIFGQHQQILSKPEPCFPPVSRLYFLTFHCHLWTILNFYVLLSCFHQFFYQRPNAVWKFVPRQSLRPFVFERFKQRVVTNQNRKRQEGRRKSGFV